MFHELIKNEAVRFAEWISMNHYTAYHRYDDEKIIEVRWCQELVDATKFYSTEELYEKFRLNN